MRVCTQPWPKCPESAQVRRELVDGHRGVFPAFVGVGLAGCERGDRERGLAQPPQLVLDVGLIVDAALAVELASRLGERARIADRLRAELDDEPRFARWQ